MQSDTAVADDHGGPLDGAATIAPVTDAMMDHAAHEAAALAEGVAHGTIAFDHAAETDHMTASKAEEAAEAMTGTARRLADTVTETASSAAGSAVAGTSETAAAAREEFADGAESASAAARDGLSASGDALSRYNAKVIEMTRGNLVSTTALLAALVQARSVPEALSINADHVSRQVAALTSQGRELADLAQAVALDALQPFKGRTGR